MSPCKAGEHTITAKRGNIQFTRNLGAGGMFPRKAGVDTLSRKKLASETSDESYCSGSALCLPIYIARTVLHSQFSARNDKKL